MPSFLIALAFYGLVFYVYHTLWLQPEKIRKRLVMQGINGPKPSFFYGNLLKMKRIDSSEKVKNEDKCISHEFKLYPSLNLWRNEYGPTFMFLKGNRNTVYVFAPETLEEITLCTSLAFGRSTAWIKQRTSLLGDSVSTLNGQAWAHH
ncbi:putative cytochrome P450 superfamily [Dioscorea sansibarensis]